MATMTKAQLVDECAELRKELDEMRKENEAQRKENYALRKENEALRSYCVTWRNKYEEYEEMHMQLRNTLDTKNAECEALRVKAPRTQPAVPALRAEAPRTQPAVPEYQAAAMQRRAQYEAAVAQGRRVKFVGHTLVDY